MDSKLSYVIILQAFITEVLTSYASSYQYAGSGTPAYSSTPAYLAGYPTQYTSALPAYQPPSPTLPAYTQPTYSTSYAPSAYPSAYSTLTQPSYSKSSTPSYQAQSAVPAAYQQPSPLQATYQQSTSVPATYQQPSPLPTAYQQSTSVPTTYQQPKVISPYQSAAPLSQKSASQIPITDILAPKPNLLPTPKVESSAPFDSNILNNLAIALQLLIVSNLLHNPPADSKAVADILNDDLLPAIAPLPIPYIPPPANTHPSEPREGNYNIPSANFLGTSSFGDAGLPKSMMGAYGAPSLPNPRLNMGFMSPYDAIANSPYSDPLTSSYASLKDFKSPYSFLTDNTIAELFLK